MAFLQDFPSSLGGGPGDVSSTSFDLSPATPVAPQQPRLTLSQEKRDFLARVICEEVDTARSHAGRQALLLKLARWNQNYEGVVSPKTFPWRNAANIWVPITLRSVRGASVRLAVAILRAEPMVLVRPRSVLASSDELEAAKRHEDWMQKRLMELLRINEEDSLGRDLLLAATRDGTAFSQLSWKAIEKRRRGYVPRPGAIDLVEETRKEEGPELEFVPIEDLEVVPATARSLDKAVGLLRRKWVRWDALLRGQKEGLYHDVDRIKSDSRPDMTNSPVSVVSDQMDGLERPPATRAANKEYQILEGLWRWDADGDGLEENLLVTIAYPDAICLRVDYYPYLHGQPYFHRWRIVNRPNRLYGMGIAEMVSHLNEEASAVHNQRLDAVTLRNVPIFKAKSGALLGESSSRNIPLYPGAFVWMEDMDSLEPLNMGEVNPSIFTEEQVIVRYCEDITGITEMKLGRPSSGRRTLGEISQVMSESNVMIDEMIACAANTLVTVAGQVAELYRQFGSGEDDLSFLDVPVQYIPNSSLQMANKQAQFQMALQLYAVMAQNPLVMQDPARLWAVTRDLLNKTDVKEPDAYIGREPPQPAPQMGAMGPAPEMGMAGPVPGEESTLGQANDFLTRQGLYETMGGGGY